MTDIEKNVYGLLCKYGELNTIEFNEKFGDDQKFREALEHLCELENVYMANVTENGVPKVKWVVDKIREKVKDNPAYHFF